MRGSLTREVEGRGASEPSTGQRRKSGTSARLAMGVSSCLTFDVGQSGPVPHQIVIQIYSREM